MPDIKLLNILNITYEVIDDSYERRKINSQTVEASSSHSCRINRAPQNKTDKTKAYHTNAQLPDYFRPNTKREADKKTRQVLENKIHSKFSDVFQGITSFEGTFSLQVRGDSQQYQAALRRVTYALQ